LVAASCNRVLVTWSLQKEAGGTMTTTANKALVTRYYDEVLNQRNLAALDDLLAPNFASWLPDGTRLGRVEYRDAVVASHQAFPDLVVEVLDQLAEGDKVATRWRASGTHRGPFAGIPATGRPVRITAMHLHRVVDGKLTGHWEEIDLLRLMRQLGVLG
jgi:steroid delta-isomerase-like uncharacterized protein